MVDRASLISQVFLAGGNFDVYLLDWQLPLYPSYLCDLFYSEEDTLLTGGLNTSGYNDPGLDDLCDQLQVETDPENAQEIVHQLQALLAADLPYLTLFYPIGVDMVNGKVVLPYTPGFGGFPAAAGYQRDARVLQE
jgi:ABC-type transport system substrate-binding protein